MELPVRLNELHMATPILYSVCIPSIYLIFKEQSPPNKNKMKRITTR